MSRAEAGKAATSRRRYFLPPVGREQRARACNEHFIPKYGEIKTHDRYEARRDGGWGGWGGARCF